MRMSRLEWKRTMNQKKMKISGGDHNGPFLFLTQILIFVLLIKIEKL